MTLLDGLAILAGGVAAGTINTIVGSGTLITFPLLLALGYPPVTANVSNTVGLAPGSISGAVAYRAELAGEGRRTARLGLASALGSVLGAVLLLALPAAAFDAIVPVFITAGVVLVIVQPRLSRALAAHRGEGVAHEGPVTLAALVVCGVYAGYFGAAQGIILLAVLGVALPFALQKINGIKNVLAGITNVVSGVVFIFAADVDWAVAGLLAAGAVVGGQLGGRYGRRLPPTALRIVIVVVGVVAVIKLVAD